VDTSVRRPGTAVADGYRTAFADWLACAAAGAEEPAARAMRASGAGLIADVAHAATAGHVLDYDDTYAAGVAHLSAACAPAALVTAASLGGTIGAALDAYAIGFEAMAALAAAAHPVLYDGGWHPTAVCAPLGAAAAAAELLELDPDGRERAAALAMLRAGGARGAFGSDGKAIQVGLAAASGVQAALLARAGAHAGAAALDGPLGSLTVLGVRRPSAARPAPAVAENWIKLLPSCLGTHSPVEAAIGARAGGHRLAEGRLEVRVHPRARQAAHLDLVQDGLSAKFSIPYCVALAALHGTPGVGDFAAVDPEVLARSREIRVAVDPALPEFGAVLSLAGVELARVDCPRDSPARPAGEAELAAKLADLAGARLQGVLADPGAPAAAVLDAAGLGPAAAPGS
jgi:2-methylcitrate dehydratase PrpD